MILYLAIYVWTDLEYFRYAFPQWTKYVVLDFTMLLGFASMPNRWGVFLQHGIEWLVANRLRLGGLWLLVVSPEIFSLLSFTTHERPMKEII